MKDTISNSLKMRSSRRSPENRNSKISKREVSSGNGSLTPNISFEMSVGFFTVINPQFWRAINLTKHITILKKKLSNIMPIRPGSLKEDDNIICIK